MEPGHEDREYQVDCLNLVCEPFPASMEPGHEDREYGRRSRLLPCLGTASMEPGHEDREYLFRGRVGALTSTSLNGARS